MPRPKIPKALERRLLYESAYVCVICQSDGCHIHHIDHNHSNNNEDNLVVLCVNHHDEAHTNRQLSKNLDAAALRAAKTEWIEYVKKRRQMAATASGQKGLVQESGFSSSGITWGYINHKRVSQMGDPNLLNEKERQNFDYCVARGLIDQNAVVIKPGGVNSATSPTNGTIYDWYEFGDDQRVHLVYVALVDQIGSNSGVLHLEDKSWTKARIKSLVCPGQIVFANRAFYFKTVQSSKDNEHRRCRTFKRNIELEFYVDTRDMFGVTSITVSFSGHKNCAALVQVKSIEETDDGKLKIHCTPIALGLGFQKLDMRT